MEVMSLLPVNQYLCSDLFSTSSQSKLPVFYSERRFHCSTRNLNFVKSKVLEPSLCNSSEVPWLLFARSMVEPFVSESSSDNCLIGGSLVLNSSNRWFFKLYPTIVRSPSLPLFSSSASISRFTHLRPRRLFQPVNLSASSFVKLLRLVRVSFLSRAPFHSLAENEIHQHQTPSLDFRRWSSLCFDPLGGGIGIIPENPSTLISLMDHFGPLVVGFWTGVKTTWTMKLGLFWVYFANCCWLVLLESVFMFSGLLVLSASLIYLMHPHCSSLASIVLTSLLFTRFAVSESLFVTPPIRRANFPGRCFTDQRLLSLSENLQTTYKRTLSGLFKVVMSWSASEKCLIFSIKRLDPIEGLCVRSDRHRLSMRFGVLSIYFPCFIVSHFEFNCFTLWPEDTIKRKVVFVID